MSTGKVARGIDQEHRLAFLQQLNHTAAFAVRGRVRSQSAHLLGHRTGDGYASLIHHHELLAQAALQLDQPQVVVPRQILQRQLQARDTAPVACFRFQAQAASNLSNQGNVEAPIAVGRSVQGLIVVVHPDAHDRMG